MTRAHVIVLVTLFAALAPAAHADVTGRASVIDGDTIEIHGQRIRLFGVDASKGERWFCSEV